jgi:hypothetical protein
MIEAMNCANEWPNRAHRFHCLRRSRWRLLVIGRKGIGASVITWTCLRNWYDKRTGMEDHLDALEGTEMERGSAVGCDGYRS